MSHRRASSAFAASPQHAVPSSGTPVRQLRRTPLQGSVVPRNCGQVLPGLPPLHLEARCWEAFEGLLHFDGRVWSQTVPATCFVIPARLTRDLSRGPPRPATIPPLRLFLVVLLDVHVRRWRACFSASPDKSRVVVHHDHHGERPMARASLTTKVRTLNQLSRPRRCWPKNKKADRPLAARPAKGRGDRWRISIPGVPVNFTGCQTREARRGARTTSPIPVWTTSARTMRLSGPKPFDKHSALETVGGRGFIKRAAGFKESYTMSAVLRLGAPTGDPCCQPMHSLSGFVGLMLTCGGARPSTSRTT